jgi:hypothetical protein
VGVSHYFVLNLNIKFGDLKKDLFIYLFRIFSIINPKKKIIYLISKKQSIKENID